MFLLYESRAEVPIARIFQRWLKLKRRWLKLKRI